MLSLCMWAFVGLTIGTKSLWWLMGVFGLYIVVIIETLITPSFHYIKNIKQADNLDSYINNLRAKRPEI
jgi:hypothetical protein